MHGKCSGGKFSKRFKNVTSGEWSGIEGGGGQERLSFYVYLKFWLRFNPIILISLATILLKGSAVVELADPWSSSFYCFLSPTFGGEHADTDPHGCRSSSPGGCSVGEMTHQGTCVRVYLPHKTGSARRQGWGLPPHLPGPQGWNLGGAQKRSLELNGTHLEKSVREQWGGKCACEHTHLYTCLRTRFLLRSMWVAVPRVVDSGNHRPRPSQGCGRKKLSTF